MGAGRVIATVPPRSFPFRKRMRTPIPCRKGLNSVRRIGLSRRGISMKALLALFGLLFQLGTAHAAFVQCNIQKSPCDEKGNLYLCSLYGWAVGDFCSATDVSNGPPKRRPFFEGM